jgi:hypothetical protein
MRMNRLNFLRLDGLRPRELIACPVFERAMTTLQVIGAS